MSVLASMALAPLPPLRSVVPDVPEGFAAIVHQCLEQAPAARPGSVVDLARALAPYASRRGRASIDSIVNISTAVSTPTGMRVVPGLRAMTPPSGIMPARPELDPTVVRPLSAPPPLVMPQPAPPPPPSGVAVGIAVFAGVALITAFVGGVILARRARSAPEIGRSSASPSAVVSAAAAPSATPIAPSSATDGLLGASAPPGTTTPRPARTNVTKRPPHSPSTTRPGGDAPSPPSPNDVPPTRR